jgi:hypothetical protein
LGDIPEALSAAQSTASLVKPYLNFMYYSARGFGDLAESCLILWESTLPNDPQYNKLRRLAETSVSAANGFAQRSPAIDSLRREHLIQARDGLVRLGAQHHVRRVEAALEEG